LIRNNRIQKCFNVGICAIVLTGTLLCADAVKPAQDVDHLELATMMVYDGKYQKAKKELAQVNPDAPGIDKARYYKLKAVMAAQKENHPQAIANLLKAIEATKHKVYVDPEAEAEKQAKRKYLFSLFSKREKKAKKKASTFDPEKIRREELSQLYMQLSQEYYKNKQYLKTVEALNKAGEAGRNRAGLYALRADCFWKAGQKERALAALNRGAARFPHDETLLKQKFYYLTDLKLYQAAIDAAKAYMKRSGANAKEYLALAQMLMNGGQRDEAIKVLEEASQKFPKDPLIKVLLGHLYLKKGMTYTAADLFEEASVYNKKYTKEAAELFRRAGDLPHALYLNANVKDKIAKLKQKIAIYIDRGEFEKVIGLKDALMRYKMLDDDNLRYALAYAYYMAKDYDNAEKELKKITDSTLFSKATIIRKNIEKCKENSLECL
jgi:tetratricopeptide (TPR) repeat protein